jgi:hypothetical protein
MTGFVHSHNRRHITLLAVVVIILQIFWITPASAEPDEDYSKLPCCDANGVRGAAWYGSDTRMTIDELAAYCAPVLWFSPNEPLLKDKSGRDITLPEPFPFEENSGSPVTYYRIRKILVREDADGEVFLRSADERGKAVIDLRQVGGIELDYFFYYSEESGFSAHKHDVESVQMKLAVWRRPECPDCPYTLLIQRILGKAHGILWYDNTLKVDQFTTFPAHILVEEAKHASCPDKNADGLYTPGYDVSERVNDAWGVRDIIGSGTMFTSQFYAWMAKTRRLEHQVFPPLPENSPFREKLSEDGVFAPDNAVYELRPFPTADRAEPKLKPFISDKGDPNWPELEYNTDLKRYTKWIGDESFAKSFAVAFRYDGDPGVSFAFPLFIFKNYQDPVGGGWLVNRIYLKDDYLRDFAWTLLYTTSASRWIDGYLSFGWEWDEEKAPDGSKVRDNYFVSETGFKFRANIGHTPLGFMKKLGTDFWGFRFGLQFKDIWEFTEIGYIIEIGAGSW